MATIRKFKVVITVRKIGDTGPFKVRKRTVPALNMMEAEHIVRKQARREGYNVGVRLEVTSMCFRFNAMVRAEGVEIFAEIKGTVQADTEADVPAAARKMLEAEGYEVGSIYNIKDVAE